MQDLEVRYVRELPNYDQSEKGVVYVLMRPKENSSNNHDAEKGKDIDSVNSYEKQGKRQIAN